MVVNLSIDFDDALREGVTKLARRHGKRGLPKLATRAECRQFVMQAMDRLMDEHPDLFYTAEQRAAQP
jgi:hypothetical protein